MLRNLHVHCCGGGERHRDLVSNDLIIGEFLPLSFSVDVEDRLAAGVHVHWQAVAAHGAIVGRLLPVSAMLGASSP